MESSHNPPSLPCTSQQTYTVSNPRTGPGDAVRSGMSSKFPSVKGERNVLTSASSAKARRESEGWARAAGREWQRSKSY